MTMKRRGVFNDYWRVAAAAGVWRSGAEKPRRLSAEIGNLIWRKACVGSGCLVAESGAICSENIEASFLSLSLAGVVCIENNGGYSANGWPAKPRTAGRKPLQ